MQKQYLSCRCCIWYSFTINSITWCWY